MIQPTLPGAVDDAPHVVAPDAISPPPPRQILTATDIQSILHHIAQRLDALEEVVVGVRRLIDAQQATTDTLDAIAGDVEELGVLVGAIDTYDATTTDRD